MSDEVVLTKDFRVAPEGHTTLVFAAGDRVSGRVAELAMRYGYAKRPIQPKNRKPAGPDEVK